MTLGAMTLKTPVLTTENSLVPSGMPRPSTMQILEIVIYGTAGQRRSIHLKPGAVNIIIGNTLRGKSAIIDIIDYCFGSGDCRIADGVKKKVAWCALRLTSGKGEIFVARKVPGPGEGATEQIYLDGGTSVRVPEFAALQQNTNVEGLINELNAAVGIKRNRTEVEEESSRDEFEATIRHALFLCLQAADEIANPNLLFHRQADDQGAIARAITDTLPYLLGAVSQERIGINDDLRRARRELKLAKRRLQEEEDIVADQRSRGRALLDEAIAVGLVTKTELGGLSYAQLKDALTKARDWTPAQKPEEAGDQYQRLLIQRAELLEKSRALKRDILEAQSVESEQQDFSSELGEQLGRLRAIGLFAHLKATALPIDSKMEVEIDELERELRGISGTEFPLADYIKNKKAERDEVLRQLAVVNESATALEMQTAAFRQLRDVDLRRAMVLGKVTLFLDSLKAVSEGGELARQHAKAQSKFEKLENQLSELEVGPRLRGPLQRIGKDMTAWAPQLDHEYKGQDFVFDERQLTVAAIGNRGYIRMRSMGGGQNHLGCHLMAHFALHKWFREALRPVPAFLILDQPTIGFYDKPKLEQKMESLQEHKQSHVRTLFDWIFRVTQAMSPDLQVIIMEHVDLSDQDLRYHDAIVEDWWIPHNALIPADWSPRF